MPGMRCDDVGAWPCLRKVRGVGEPFEIPTAAELRGLPEWQRCGIARTLEADPMPKQFPKTVSQGRYRGPKHSRFNSRGHR